MKNLDALYINGRWQPPAGAETIDVIDATTEAVIARIPAGGATDVRAAALAARAALESWLATPPAERGAAIARVAAALKRRSEELARTITREVGMPLKLSSRLQVGGPILAWESYATLAAEFEYQERIGNSLVAQEPVGVVACITPWNYPLHQVTAKVAAALAAGCTVVLKPSEVAPLSAFMLAEAVEEAELPAGVFNLVTGYGPVVGEALVTDPDVDMVSFTGSTLAGRRVAALAAAGVKRVALELGGKSASVVLDDADLAAAVRSTVGSCFLNSGQTCSALTRMLVPEALYEQVRTLAREIAASYTVGNPEDPATRLGPLASAAQRERVQEFIRTGIAEGAELVAGGAEAPDGVSGGYFIRPTVFGRVSPHSTLAQEEVFGPVLSIITYRDEDDAIRIANDTRYGLAAAVWSADETRALRVARRLRAGQVDINGAPFNLAAPFGGFKQSGIGRENGRYGLEEFLEAKSIQLKS